MLRHDPPASRAARCVFASRDITRHTRDESYSGRQRDGERLSPERKTAKRNGRARLRRSCLVGCCRIPFSLPKNLRNFRAKQTRIAPLEEVGCHTQKRKEKKRKEEEVGCHFQHHSGCFLAKMKWQHPLWLVSSAPFPNIFFSANISILASNNFSASARQSARRSAYLAPRRRRRPWRTCLTRRDYSSSIQFH